MFLTNRVKPPGLEQANRRMNRLLVYSIGFMFLYGLVLPDDWRELFGIFSWPIDWAAHTVPSTVKAVSVSPIPKLVAGFFGMATWVIVAFVVSMVWKDPLGERVRYAFNQPGKSPWKMGAFLYLLFLPLDAMLIWAAFVLPGRTYLGYGTNWAAQVFYSMISERFALAFYGSLITTGVGMFIFLLAVGVFGPFYLLHKGEK